MTPSIHHLARNDLTGAVELLKQQAALGPVGTDLIQSLAMLQDRPLDFYRAIEGVAYEVREPE